MKIESDGLRILEKDIEDWLWENPSAIKVGYTGQPIKKWLARQYTVNSGRIDLLGVLTYSDRAYPVVVEIKKVPISIDAVAQVCRYAADVDEILTGVECEFVHRHAEMFGYDFVPKSTIGHYTVKVVIGPGMADDNVLRTADAMNVLIHTFTVDMSLNVHGMIGWKKDYLSECRKKSEAQINDDAFVEFSNIVDGLVLINEAKSIMNSEEEDEQEA